MTVRYKRCNYLWCEHVGIVLAPCIRIDDVDLPDAEPCFGGLYWSMG